MVLLQGIHASKISPIRATSECSVMKNKDWAAADRFVINARTLIVGEWHVRAWRSLAAR